MDVTIYKDYSKKTKTKLSILNSINNTVVKETDLNEFIAFLNFSFQKKNNFFVENFNKRVIKNVYLSYNQLKTNILTPTINDIFENISVSDIKLFRFIITNFVNNYETIIENNEELCEYISKDSMKRFLTLLNLIITQKE